MLNTGAPPLAGSPTSLANVRAALTLLGALRRGGLIHGVLCPGSRSAPLAVAAALLEPGGLRLHTAIDERSAAFFALGLGRASGQPAAVITTSGTAVANLLPAAVEADFGSVPLLLLTADRPARLKGCGANQSVNQEVFLVGSCRWLGEGDPEGLAAMSPAELDALAGQALAAARGDGAGRSAGPVHLNLPFDEPLHADGTDLSRLAAALAGEPPPPPASGALATRVGRPACPVS
ncbi:2-succinyl-5-enolpyruvyl-6-hydroxy-3-cyclohexene-1-carboxylate synthase, partial [Cyanobium sp. Lug-B]|nr:2-succinyl-5-enolpyruvyl-6-hydroxy-3-cyclohexene-1-carboxylate synthase [Cyanobium sp. Lug-B]